MGLILGSATSITLALSGVAIVFLVLQPQYPRLEFEFGAVLMNLCLFSALTVTAALSFYSQLSEADWRWAAHSALALVLGGLGWYYWPQ